MKYMLDIGSYNRFGKFTSSEWVIGLSILKAHTNYLVVYCSQDIDTLFGRSSFADIVELNELGKTCGYKAYKIFPTHEQFWFEFQNLNFHPDNGISHSYGYNKFGTCICSLEVDDEVSYLVFESLDVEQVMVGSLVENYQMSFAVREYILEIVDGGDWKRLIVENKKVGGGSKN